MDGRQTGSNRIRVHGLRGFEFDRPPKRGLREVGRICTRNSACRKRSPHLASVPGNVLRQHPFLSAALKSSSVPSLFELEYDLRKFLIVLSGISSEVRAALAVGANTCNPARVVRTAIR
jgi:hypothetical protein